MAVCDSTKKFIIQKCGFLGSAHDSRVYKDTDLHHIITTNLRFVFPSPKFYIVGDTTFPMDNALQKHRASSTYQVELFDVKYSKTRVLIYIFCACLKGRFRKSKFIDADLERVQQSIVACFVLHTITLECCFSHMKYMTFFLVPWL